MDPQLCGPASPPHPGLLVLPGSTSAGAAALPPPGRALVGTQVARGCSPLSTGLSAPPREASGVEGADIHGVSLRNDFWVNGLCNL